jgi:hypothetical protein
MVTKNSTIPDTWNELFQSDQPLNMGALLKSGLLAAESNANLKQSIAMMVSGPISIIASMLLVTHILRSYEGLSTTYHRLIFGLSVADIVYSFAITLSSTMAPKEVSYLVSFASGNVATCDAQGFLVIFANGVSVCYNCSVCFYYLGIITYNKKYDYIEKKLEPWFHGISILLPLTYSAILLATNAFNGSNGGVCFADPYAPPHCIGYEVGDIPEGYSIPCGRGGPLDGHAKLRTIALFGALLLALIIAPATIVITMTSMFRSVAKIEKRMQNYGVSALRLRTALAAPTTTSNSAGDQEEGRAFALKIKKVCKYLCLTAPDAGQVNDGVATCCLRRPQPSQVTKSNKMTSQKRAVLQMAFGYAGAWFLVWTPFFIRTVVLIVLNSVPDALLVLSFCITPLQGFFNFVVFMAPKVRTARMMSMRQGRKDSVNNNSNQNQHLTWCQALSKAYMSRGRLEGKNSRNNNLSSLGRRSTIRVAVEKVQLLFARMKSFTTSLIPRRIPSPPDEQVVDTNECLLESGRSPAASSS